MEHIIERLEKDIKADTDLAFTTSTGKLSERRRPEADQLTDTETDSPSMPYTTSPLTDESVSTLEQWLDDEFLQNVRKDAVVSELDEILLLLVMIREEASGKELTEDLRRVFGASLSPGTVYPHLNELANEGKLEVKELKKRKIYTICNLGEVLGEIESTVNRQIIFLLVMKALLIDVVDRHSQSNGVS
jgi:DNA-binding transcriptional ArsR family regulator